VTALTLAVLLGRWLFVIELMLIKVDLLIVAVVGISLAALGFGQSSDSIVVAATF
jgi:hypothetical protein